VNSFRFPISQGELIRTARAGATQAAFAKLLGVDRSCLSRYESEALGAPTSVLNHCLKVVAQQCAKDIEQDTDFQRALRYAKGTVTALETLKVSLSKG
jgi:DNA-binding XRE family transcriptional regulator